MRRTVAVELMFKRPLRKSSSQSRDSKQSVAHLCDLL